MSEKCRNKRNNNNSDNPLTSRRTDGGKKKKNGIYNFSFDCRSKTACVIAPI